MRIAFLGSWALGWGALAGLLTAGREVAAVWTVDAPTNPVGSLARRLSIPVHSARSMRDGAPAVQALRDADPDLAVMANYSRILGPEAIRVPRLGVVNLHPSLLPRHRGAAPLRWTLLCGDTQTGVTAIRADEGIDTGDVLAVARVPVAPDDDYRTLTQRLTVAMSDLAARLDPQGPGTTQQGDATEAPRLTEEDMCLRWDRPAADLLRIVRACDPPGAWFSCDGDTVRVRAAVLAHSASSHPGDVTDGPTIQTTDGALRLIRWDGPAPRSGQCLTASG